KNKHQTSQVQSTQEKSGTLKILKSETLKSKSCDQLSAFDEMKIGSQNNDYGAEDYISCLTIEKRYCDQSEAGGLQNNKRMEFDPSLSVEEVLNMWKEADEMQAASNDRFTESHELDNIGIMNLSSMNLTDNNMPSIIQRAFTEEKSKCVGLILRDNALTSVGVMVLVEALLKTRTKLKYLSFSNNTAIGDRGIEHLVRLLQKNRSITFLALPNTGITDHGVRLLADVLCGIGPNSSCSPLEKLHISFNKSITDESIEVLIQILEQNKTLKTLALQHCGLSEDARDRLRQVAAKKKKKKFSLSE
ncbi:unnamed protein product, partial [Rotaria magnacalcarata]